MSSIKDFQTEFLRRDMRNSFQGIAAYLSQYQKYFDESLSNVKIDVYQVVQGHEEVRESIRQFMAGQYLASSKEGDHMSESITELKTKVNDIDKTVNGINVSIGKLETEIRLRFDTVNESLNKILTKLESAPSKDYIQNEIQTPISAMNTKLAEYKKDIDTISGKLETSVSNKKWLFTTIVACIGAAGAVLKLILG